LKVDKKQGKTVLAFEKKATEPGNSGGSGGLGGTKVKKNVWWQAREN